VAYESLNGKEVSDRGVGVTANSLGSLDRWPSLPFEIWLCIDKTRRPSVPGRAGVG
jgi:hypothetical protein